MSPCTAARPADRLLRGHERRHPRSCRSAVGVARAAAVADRAAALASSSGRAGPSTSISGHRAVAELLVEPADHAGREQLELGGPGGRVGAHDQPCRRRTTRVCSAAATSRADERRPSGRRPRAPAGRCSQPWSATSRSIVDVEQLRVALVGVGAGGLRAGPRLDGGLRCGRRRRRPCAAGQPATAARSSPARWCVARSRPSSWRAARPAAAPAAGSAGSSSVDTGHLPVGHVEAGARAAPRARRRAPRR